MKELIPRKARGKLLVLRGTIYVLQYKLISTKSLYSRILLKVIESNQYYFFPTLPLLTKRIDRMIIGWRENGRGKKMGGEKMERKENGRENVIPHHAWMDEGK